jgi:hypothetical protein
VRFGEERVATCCIPTGVQFVLRRRRDDHQTNMAIDDVMQPPIMLTQVALLCTTPAVKVKARAGTPIIHMANNSIIKLYKTASSTFNLPNNCKLNYLA